MKSQQIRHVVFFLHRYLGLVVGLLLIVVGLTGSLLVFQREIDQFLVSQQFGQIITPGDRLPVESILENGLQPSRADHILDSFVPMHYGTFWELTSRILYVFVGLTPLILFITGFVMWRYRHQNNNKKLIES